MSKTQKQGEDSFISVRLYNAQGYRNAVQHTALLKYNKNITKHYFETSVKSESLLDVVCSM